MKHINKIFILTFLLAITGLISCGDDENVTPIEQDGITMAFKTTGGDETEFLITEENLMEGEISAVGQGIEQLGWRFYYPVGNTLMTSGFSVDNKLEGYARNDEGDIQMIGNFMFENALEVFGAEGETLLAMEIPRAGFANRNLYFVDANTVTSTKNIGTKIFENRTDSLVAWPTALQVRDNKLFIPFHKLDAKGEFTTPNADSAFVAVYSYPNVGTEPEKIISDPRTSNIGVNGSTTGLIETENGDLYSFSHGGVMAGFAPASTKPSGILRIPAGATDFDDSYFFNIEEATDGGKIFWFDYVGGNKAIARILTHDDGVAWGAFSRDYFNQKLVIIDLVNQTVTDVANVPLHAKRYSSPVFVKDGKVYESIETETEAYIYEIDVATATGTRGAKISGKTIKGFFEL